VESMQPQGVKVIRPSRKKLIDLIWLNEFRGQFENSAHREFNGWIKQQLPLAFH
jgi:hypothetical protein